MKKLFYMAMAALLSVGLASCEKDPVQKGPISIEISNVDITSATVTCTPDDVTKPYLFTYYEKAAFDTLTFDQIAEEQIESMDFYIMFLELLFGETYTYADFASLDVFTDDLAGLIPDTKYVAIAYYMDPETGMPTAEEASYTTFKTAAVKEVGKENIYFIPEEWQDFVEEEGWWQLMAESQDGKYYLSLSNLNNETVEGTYTLSDMDLDYTSLFDISGEEQEEIPFADLKLTITMEDGMYVFKCNALGINGIRYNMTFEPVDPASAVKGAPARNANTAAKKNIFSNEPKIGFMGQKLLKK